MRADGSTITADNLHVAGGSGRNLLDAQPSIAFTERVLRGQTCLCLSLIPPLRSLALLPHW